METSSPIAERHVEQLDLVAIRRRHGSAASLFSTLPPRRPPLLARQEGRNEEPGLPAFLLSLEVLLFGRPRSAQ